MIRRITLAALVALTALPALAGAGFDLPRLDFPAGPHQPAAGTTATTSAANGK